MSSLTAPTGHYLATAHLQSQLNFLSGLSAPTKSWQYFYLLLKSQQKRERRLIPLGNMSFKTERWYSTVSIGNELPSNLYLSVQLIPPPLMWFLGNPKSISTLSSSNGATLFLPIQTRFRFWHSSSIYFWTLRGSSPSLSSSAFWILSVSIALPIQVCNQYNFLVSALWMVCGGSGRRGNQFWINKFWLHVI